MKNEFIEFLKTWGVYEKFTANVTEPSWSDKPQSEFVEVAFVWGDSDDGVDFWQYISNEWVDYLEYWNEELDAEYGA